MNEEKKVHSGFSFMTNWPSDVQISTCSIVQNVYDVAKQTLTVDFFFGTCVNT